MKNSIKFIDIFMTSLIIVAVLVLNSCNKHRADVATEPTKSTVESTMGIVPTEPTNSTESTEPTNSTESTEPAEDRVRPVSDYMIVGAWCEGNYVTTELGHCWEIYNPDNYIGMVEVVYQNHETLDIEDDVLILVMECG